LIHAASGALGLAAVQLAKRAGARVMATASSPGKLEALRTYGVDVGIDYVREDFVAASRTVTNGQGVHLVIDSIAGENLARSIQALAYRGRAITVGVSGRDLTVVIDAVYSLSEAAEAAEAHRYIAVRKALGRVILCP
jgi:NADPH2:quinone reductase